MPRRLAPAKSDAAMCAARASDLKEKLKEEANHRMRQGGEKAGKHRVSQGPDARPDPEKQGDTRDQLGAKFGISGKTVERAEKLLRDGIPELVQAVDNYLSHSKEPELCP